MKLAAKIIARAREMCETLNGLDVMAAARVAEIAMSGDLLERPLHCAHRAAARNKPADAGITVFIERTEHVMGTATRRVINGEDVPNEDKLFSIFEPHTQLYKRGNFVD